jgi:hypothetical protein
MAGIGSTTLSHTERRKNKRETRKEGPIACNCLEVWVEVGAKKRLLPPPGTAKSRDWPQSGVRGGDETLTFFCRSQYPCVANS